MQNKAAATPEDVRHRHAHREQRRGSGHHQRRQGRRGHVGGPVASRPCGPGGLCLHPGADSVCLVRVAGPSWEVCVVERVERGIGRPAGLVEPACMFAATQDSRGSLFFLTTASLMCLMLHPWASVGCPTCDTFSTELMQLCTPPDPGCAVLAGVWRLPASWTTRSVAAFLLVGF